MAIVESEIFRALGHLLIAYMIYIAWKLSYEATAKIGFKKVLLKGLLWCAGIAVFATITLGTHTENYDDDPFYGRGETVQDYKPTNEQRFANFAYYITILYLPVIVGAIKGRKNSKFKENDDENG